MSVEEAAARANILRVLRACSYPGFSFEFSEEFPNLFVRVVCKDARDNVTGEPTSWAGRKWRLSPHMTDGEIVQTAWAATMTAIEHEAREQFKFLGQAVFDPHYDIYKLVELRAQPGAIKERA